MLFNLFGKTNKETAIIFTDKVFVSSSAKMNACLQLAKDQTNILFIAWFAETAKKFTEYFARHGFAGIEIVQASRFHIGKLADKIPVFLEHYPLHEKELALMQQWPSQTIMVYSSMDEPLFKELGSDKMIPLIKLLGMKESEAIEHSFVTQSIMKGQQKIASKVGAEQPAGSQAEWMRKNFVD